jgi:hypothetical protein
LEFLHPAHGVAVPLDSGPDRRTFSSPTPGRVRRRPQVGPVALGQLQRLVHRHEAEATVPKAVVIGILQMGGAL